MLQIPDELHVAIKISNQKSASVYECGRFTCTIKHLGQMPPKHVAGLPTQVVNDKGRYRQLRARWQSPDLLKSQPPSKIPVISEALREISPVGTKFGSPLRRGRGIVDVNVLYHSLSR